MSNSPEAPRYLIGFWLRFVARFADNLLIAAAFAAVALPILGIDYFRKPDQIGPTVIAAPILLHGLYRIGFWFRKSATPGNWLLSHQVRDFATGCAPSLLQCVGRWLGMFVSALPLGLGFVWTAWDKHKRAWHDHFAGTVVVSDATYQPYQSDRRYVAESSP